MRLGALGVLPVAAALAGLALLGVYAVAGGADYRPQEVRDPCETRPWRNPDGAQELAEQIVLSSLDGAACELGVSREQLTLAFGSRDDLDAFARSQGLSDEQVEDALRVGVDRAVSDAREADAIGFLEALALHAAVKTIPIERLLDGLRDSNLDW